MSQREFKRWMVTGIMRVLIVDDQPVSQTALVNILSARSDVEHFDSANDAIEVFEKMATDSYDVLLLDIDLDLSRSPRK